MGLFKWITLNLLAIYFNNVGSIIQNVEEKPVCPKNWVEYVGSCYKFNRSPLKKRQGAKEHCQTFNSDLLSLNTMEEHSFVIGWLRENDPQHLLWYTSGKQQGSNVWINEGDNSQLNNLEDAFLPQYGQIGFGGEFMAYSFSASLRRWGLKGVNGSVPSCYICEIPVHKLDYINIDDRDHEYGLQIVDKNYVPRGPYFLQQPHPVVFDIGRRRIINHVTITCIAKGYPQPTFEWHKEEYENNKLVYKKINPMEDSRYTVSGGSLIISDPHQINDRGKYHCRAENEFGKILSESVQLSFGYIGEFNLKRSQDVGYENWGKAIYCDPPQAYPGVNYYWSRDSFPNLVEEDKRTFVSHDGNLYFSSLEIQDQGNYSCNVQSVSSATGRNGPKFRVGVIPHANYQQLKFPNNFPKAFPEAPMAGEDVRLECVAFGYPVPSYNWTRKGNVGLPPDAKLSSYNRILLLPKVKVSDQGEYVCTAANSKVAIENSVTLSIQAKPHFTIPLEDQHLDINDDISWICEAFGIPEVHYEWYRNGELMIKDQLDPEFGSRYDIQENILTIRSVNPEVDPAMFQCKATNQLGSAYSTGQLRVLNIKPSFDKFPLEPEVYAARGGNVTIACNPEAAPRPEFTWKKNGALLATGGRRVVLSNGNLFINPVSTEDYGTYTCVATNQYGVAESSGDLVVLEGPTLTYYPKEKYIVSIHSSLVLPCVATADPKLDLTYIWSHNGIRIDLESNPQYSMTQFDGTLAIEDIRPENVGTYECIVKTSVAKISTLVNLIVHGPPGPPGGILAYEVKKTSAKLTWSDCSNNGVPVEKYLIEARTLWNDTWSPLVQNITAEDFDSRIHRKQFFLDNLSPFSRYEFRIACLNSLGYGSFSLPSPMYNTLQDKPYVAPSNVQGGGGKTGDLTIRWDALSRENQNAPGVWYKVFWRRVEINPEFEWNFKPLQDHGNINTYVLDVDPLKYFYCQYEVKVQAWNALGAGPISEIATIYSAEGMPQDTPTQVAAYPHNATALNITWKPIAETRNSIRGKLIGFRVKYWRKTDKESDALYLLSRSTRAWSLIVGLQANTEYYVRVMVFNGAGPGAESERYLERTFKSAPLKPPSSVQVYGINPSTIRVTWRYVSPGSLEEPLLGYRIMIWEAEQDFSTAREIEKLLGGPLEAYVYDLVPGKTYKLRVMAFSQGGYGRMSSPAWQFQMGDPEYLKSFASQHLLSYCPLIFIACVHCIVTSVWI